ncbi:MAG: VWA domain-containing protein, partial [Burkholderiales bacterium]|nr:VWA domain-containing protein [Burkholderiales bacterium]
HARHAERTLLTYEDDDRLHHTAPQKQRTWRARDAETPDRRLEAGPLIVCVDTSGSMQGGAEAVAKATILEAARSAHAQRRACHVFAFGGPGEIVEAELGFDADGVERLAQFIAQTYKGGTDICGPLERALAKLATLDWRLADLVIASDGEFGATAALAQAVAAAKATLGLRVQGILIGDRETIGMLELADDVLWIRDWRRYGGHDARVPEAMRSLTARYFPGALRVPAARRAAPASGADAAAAVMRGQR